MSSLYFPKLDLSIVSQRPARDAETKFPCKLYHMLDDIDREKRLTNIISWHPNGHCFRVHEPETFVATVLPLYFKKAKWRSFQRQLNLYGFHRMTALNPFWESCYHHPDFQRGNEIGCRKINRPLRRKPQTAKANYDESASSRTRTISLDALWVPPSPLPHGISSSEGTEFAPEDEKQENEEEETPLNDQEEEEEIVKRKIYNSTLDDNALTRESSYQDLCKTIMGPNCEACNDGSKLLNDVLS